ncbi:MAG: virulence-associated E family protein [Rhodobacteraceae bacterium]|nr:virulence-associated E family protein [Paracoccaceae bacterium]
MTNAKAKSKGKSSKSYEAELIRDHRNRLKWCPENACLILEKDSSWGGVLAYDEFNAQTVLLRPIPEAVAPHASFISRHMTEADVIEAVRWFNRNGFPDATKNVTHDAILTVAGYNRFNPVQEYLEGLTWDGVQRVDSWLAKYLSAEDAPFVNAVGKAWLVSAVARALNPGIKADCMLVLEGRQGVGKSTAIRVLAGDDWFHDGLHDLSGKDASAGLRGKWIIELPELSAMRKSDVEAVKAFLSRTKERYRPAYGRTEVIEPRRCVFIGTTNRSDWLMDETGGRRFWPVTVGEVKLAELQSDRDQIWAEAVSLFHAGEPWWLDQAAEVEAANVVFTRTVEDPWEADVISFVENRSEVSTRDILFGLGITKDRLTKSDQMRVAGILARAGWIRNGRFTSGGSRGSTRYVSPPRNAP